MANSFNNHLPRRVAIYYWKLKSITGKIYKTASSFGFIKKSIYHEVTPTFAKVNGHFIHKKDRWKCEHHLLLSHLESHSANIKSLYVNITKVSYNIQFQSSHSKFDPASFIRE